jgi:VanZ family protein
LRTLALRALAPLALMGLIFYLSAQEAVGPDLPAWTRPVAHFSEYALLAALWGWALAPSLGRHALPAAAAISLLYAISDEYHQSFVEGRDSDAVDVLVDAIGIACGLLAVDRLRARGAIGSPCEAERSGAEPRRR